VGDQRHETISQLALGAQELELSAQLVVPPDVV
jgi:hypothetical protein